MALSFSVILLSVLVILGSGRFTIGKMICTGGMATYSLGNAKDCCKKNDDQKNSVENSCCKLINVSYSLDDFSPSLKINSTPHQLVFEIPSFDLKLQTFNFRLPTFYSDLPPPDTKDRLHILGSLLL